MTSPLNAPMGDLKVSHVENWADDEEDEAPVLAGSNINQGQDTRHPTLDKQHTRVPGPFACVVSSIPANWSAEDVGNLFFGLVILEVYVDQVVGRTASFIVDLGEKEDLILALNKPPEWKGIRFYTRPFHPNALGPVQPHRGDDSFSGIGRGPPPRSFVDSRGLSFRDGPYDQGPGWGGSSRQSSGFGPGFDPRGQASLTRGFSESRGPPPIRSNDRWTSAAPQPSVPLSMQRSMPPVSTAADAAQSTQLLTSTGSMPVAGATAEAVTGGAPRPRTNPFGAAKPVDTASKLKELEEKAAQARKEAEEQAKKDAEEKRRAEQEAAEAEAERLQKEQEDMAAAAVTAAKHREESAREAARQHAMAQAQAAAKAATPAAMALQQAVHTLAAVNPQALSFGEIGPDYQPTLPSVPAVASQAHAAPPAGATPVSNGLQAGKHHQHQPAHHHKHQQPADGHAVGPVPPGPPAGEPHHPAGHSGRGGRGGRGERGGRHGRGSGEAGGRGHAQPHPEPPTRADSAGRWTDHEVPHGGGRGDHAGRGRGRGRDSAAHAGEEGAAGQEGAHVVSSRGGRGGRGGRGERGGRPGRGGRGEGSHDDTAVVAATAVGSTPSEGIAVGGKPAADDSVSATTAGHSHGHGHSSEHGARGHGHLSEHGGRGGRGGRGEGRGEGHGRRGGRGRHSAGHTATTDVPPSAPAVRAASAAISDLPSAPSGSLPDVVPATEGPAHHVRQSERSERLGSGRHFRGEGGRDGRGRGRGGRGRSDANHHPAGDAASSDKPVVAPPTTAGEEQKTGPRSVNSGPHKKHEGANEGGRGGRDGGRGGKGGAAHDKAPAEKSAAKPAAAPVEGKAQALYRKIGAHDKDKTGMASLDNPFALLAGME